MSQSDLSAARARIESLEALIERVLTEHWDMAACSCAFCSKGRELGMKPREKYDPNPRLSILAEQAPGSTLVYDWTERE